VWFALGENRPVIQAGTVSNYGPGAAQTGDQAGTRSRGPTAQGPRRRGFATRRRLITAFAFVFAVSLLAAGVQVLALRRMETTLAVMAALDERMQLALQLESAVSEQYAHQGLYVGKPEPDLLANYQQARDRTREVAAALAARLDDPEAAGWMATAQAAVDELDRVFREQLEPAVHRWDVTAIAIHEGSYPLVPLVSSSADRICARLQLSISESRRELVRIEETALRLNAATLVLLTLFVTGAVVYLSRSVARPLARLSEGATAVAAGDLDARFDIDTPDEFGALASEFRAMTVALKEHQQALVESEKLAGIGRLAAGLAHELNNPLQVMLGYLSLNRDVPDRSLAAQLAATEEEALRCTQLIEDLLELSRSRTEAVPVDLRGLCEDVAGGLRVAARDTLELSVDGAARTLGDRPRLRQVLVNLMRNAVEAAGPAGRVSVRVRTRGERVEVDVSDSGPGISSEARAHLFEPFFTTKPSGTGLGLAVSRATALAHGGDIDVRNGDAGGAVFTLRLPRAPEGRA